jgi:hypothetical protein
MTEVDRAFLKETAGILGRIFLLKLAALPVLLLQMWGLAGFPGCAP